MQETDSVPFTDVLRQKVQTGNDAQVKQAAIQAIEQLERLSTQVSHPSLVLSEPSQVCNDGSSTITEDITDSNQLVTVTSHQLRMLRRDLREMTKQRDDALEALKSQKEKDARRYNDIQELQTELNSALEQYEQLLPKFKEVLASRRELESRVQTLTKDLQRRKEIQQELEEAIVNLLSTCEGIIKDSGHESRALQTPTLLDSIFTIKAELEEMICNKPSRPENHRSPWEGTFGKSGMEEENNSLIRRASHELIQRPRTATPTPPQSDLSPVVESMKLMVDHERDMRKYFESQTVKLQRMKSENDPRRRSSWTMMSPDWNKGRELPPTDIQLQERMMISSKIQDKDQEISELFTELEQTRMGDENLINALLSLDDSHLKKHSQRGNSSSNQQSTGDLTERLNRLQECAGMLEKQLLAVQSENKDLRIEKQHLLNRIQATSSSK
eukprot:g7007.t1